MTTRSFPPGKRNPVRQVHHDKRGFAQHVDPTERLVEFNAIENRDGIADDDHIAEMHVAMTLANESGRLSSDEDIASGFEFPFAPVSQPLDASGVVNTVSIQRVETNCSR